MSSPTFGLICEVLSKEFKVPAERLQPNTLMADLGLDSLGMVDFIFHLEDRLNIKVPEEKLDPRQAQMCLADVARVLDEGLAAAHTSTPAA